MGDHECSMKLGLNNNLELKHPQPDVKFCTQKTVATSLRWLNVGNDRDCSISVTLEYLE